MNRCTMVILRCMMGVMSVLVNLLILRTGLGVANYCRFIMVSTIALKKFSLVRSLRMLSVCVLILVVCLILFNKP